MFVVSPYEKPWLRYTAAFINVVAPNFLRQMITTLILAAIASWCAISGAMTPGNWLLAIACIIALSMTVMISLMIEALRRKARSAYVTDSLVKSLYRDWGKAIKEMPESERKDARFNRFNAARVLTWQELTTEQFAAEIDRYRQSFTT